MRAAQPVPELCLAILRGIIAGTTLCSHWKGCLLECQSTSGIPAANDDVRVDFVDADEMDCTRQGSKIQRHRR